MLQDGLDSLTDRFEEHKTESTIVLDDVITTLEVLKNSNSTDYIAQENTSLKRENNLLKEELDKLKCVVSELNKKLIAAENDKASLLTAIRLLNDDRAFNHARVNSPINSNESNQVNQTANHWHAVTSSSNSKSNSSQQQPLPLKNKYSVLRVEDEENLEKNEDIAAKQDRENSQSTSDKSSLKESAFNKKTGRNKGTKTDTVIVGDSMIKYVKGWEMSSATNRVTVKSFSGATIEDMLDYMKPILRKKPEKVILHIETNNLRKGDAKSVADGIINLAKSIE